MSKSDYRADIDGLRGIAVIAVVLFHLHVGLPGGYTGVDVFFVISGFLITRLILQAQADDRFSLKQFWMRRVRRLAPAAMVVLLISLIAAAWLMYPRDFYYFTKSTIAQVALASNIHFANYLDYFAGPAERHPLLHTWSLAVEEQFYLLFPLLLVAARGFRRWQLGTLLATIAVGSFILSTVKVHTAPINAFFLLPSRAWELMVGALLVFAPAANKNQSRWLWESLSIAGLMGVAYAMVTFTNTTRFPGPTALIPCLATAAVIYANTQHRTAAYRLLAWRPLVGVGLISYSLYLWHWPILSFSHYVLGESLPWQVATLCGAASVACGYLSWRYVETPFRQRKVVADNQVLLRWAVACSLLVVGVSVSSLVTRGIPSRWGADAAKALANSSNNMKRFRRGLAEHVQQDKLPAIGDTSEDKSPSVLVWGDSHAGAAGHICDELAKQHGIRGYVACRGGCIPLLNTWREGRKEEVVPWNDAVLDFVQRKKIQNVILVSRWSANILVRPNGLKDVLLKDAKSAEHTSRDSQRVVREGLERTVAALRAAGAKVWILKQTPDQPGDPLRLMIRARRKGEPARGISLADHRQHEQHIYEIFDSLEHVNFIDPTQHCFTEDGLSLVGSTDCSYYSDPSHLSTAGSQRFLGPTLNPVFRSIATEVRLAKAAGTGVTTR